MVCLVLHHSYLSLKLSEVLQSKASSSTCILLLCGEKVIFFSMVGGDAPFSFLGEVFCVFLHMHNATEWIHKC